MEHIVSGLTALAALLWRWYHPNEEKTIERKFFFIVFGAALAYHAWRLLCCTL
jgi:hypothetical protein